MPDLRRQDTRPPTSLNVMVSSWPFSIWGINVIRPITPKASNDHRFIFVVIDYFIKWVEAASYASVTKSVVARFIKREIICRYRLSKRIISDNGLNLNNDMVTEVCTRFKIKYHNLVPYRPKMNGTVEAANKNVKKIIAKAIKNTKISTKSCLLLYMLIELGFRHRLGQLHIHWSMEWRLFCLSKWKFRLYEYSAK